MIKADKESVLQWDVTSWSKALEFWEENIDFDKVESALELGGRQGGLSLWLAQKDIEVVCSDLSDVEKLAKPLHEKFGVVEKISYQDIDATNIPYENHFDLIVFKSIIGGIGRDNNKKNQQAVFESIHKALKPGGKLLFAENTTASPVHGFFRRRFVGWSGHWRYVSIAEIREFLSPFSSYELNTTGFAATFGRTEGQRKLLAWKDNLIFNHIVPKNWKYIAYGIAVK